MRMENLRVAVVVVIVLWCFAHELEAQQQFHPYHSFFVQAHRLTDAWNNPDTQKVSNLLNKVNSALAQSSKDTELQLLRIYLLLQLKDYSTAVQEIESLSSHELNPQSLATYLRYKCYVYWKVGRYLESFSILFPSLLTTIARLEIPAILLVSLTIIIHVLQHNNNNANNKFFIKLSITILLLPLLLIVSTLLSDLLVAGAPMPVHKGDRARAFFVNWVFSMLMLLGLGNWLRRANPSQLTSLETSNATLMSVALLFLALINAVYMMRDFTIPMLQLAFEHSTLLYWLFIILSIGFGTFVHSNFVLRSVYSGLVGSLPFGTAILLSLSYGVLGWWLVEALSNHYLPFVILIVAASILLYKDGKSWHIAAIPIALARFSIHLQQFVTNLGQL
ncbi:hypothetical protein HRbin15_02151 [bacterium HR15]|nr:hypothetical protein HRbin15_02151 [bacterium HR15]